MKNKEFAVIRKNLGKTQKEIATLLGISLKAICSYEQGWRTIPGHVERQLIFLLAQKRKTSTKIKNCWDLKKCPPSKRKKCPAWEFKSGKFCWFISGTMCECSAQKNWHEKFLICKECVVMHKIMDGYIETEPSDSAPAQSVTSSS